MQEVQRADPTGDSIHTSYAHWPAAPGARVGGGRALMTDSLQIGEMGRACMEAGFLRCVAARVRASEVGMEHWVVGAGEVRMLALLLCE
jgi:hypothetical protein